MKIGIYDPYLDTLGGGEKYTLTAAMCLSRKHDVYLFWDNKEIVKRAKYLFPIDFSKIKFARNIFSPKIPIVEKLLKTRKYDVVIYVSDGSIPLSMAEKNILIFQFPVNWVEGRNFWTRLKLSRVNKVLCYSKFVKKFLDKTFSINSFVLAPPVDMPESKSIKKENIILSVGRFTKGMNTKKQEVLIDVFKKMRDKGFTNWRLILMGGVLPADQDFVEELKNKTSGYPIEIFSNASLARLTDFYKKAKIYWHAAGFGEDLEKHPERAEHFGISTVEAMANGAVPIVFNGGGQREIVQDGENGLLWKTHTELQDKTLWAIRDDATWQRLSESAKSSSITYSKERFCRELNEIIKV